MSTSADTRRGAGNSPSTHPATHTRSNSSPCARCAEITFTARGLRSSGSTQGSGPNLRRFERLEVVDHPRACPAPLGEPADDVAEPGERVEVASAILIHQDLRVRQGG